MMVLNLSRIRCELDLVQAMVAFKQQFPDLHKVHVDQDFQNYTFQRDCFWLDKKYNSFSCNYRDPILPRTSTGVIWHFAGTKAKPWDAYRSPLDVLYWRYLVLTPWSEAVHEGVVFAAREIMRVKRSRSWRMTRPYRELGDLIRKLFKKITWFIV